MKRLKILCVLLVSLFLLSSPAKGVSGQEDYNYMEIDYGQLYDLMIGGNSYSNTSGIYLWSKFRWRPFWIIDDKGMDIGIGPFISGAFNPGESSNGYDYENKQLAAGITFKLIGERYWDANLDLGLGRLWKEGDKGLYRSEQTDDIFIASSYFGFYHRRARGEKWFPKAGFNLGIKLPYDASSSRSLNGKTLEPKPKDNDRLELTYFQGIYDFKANNNIRFTPGINISFGREGGPEKNFFKIGPNITFSLHNEDIFRLYFFNYQEQLGGDGDKWYWIGFYADIVDIAGVLGAW